MQKKKKKVWISFSYYTDLKNPNIMYVFTAHIICCLLSWISHINLSLLLTWSTFFCFRPQWTLFLVPVAPSFFFLSFLKLFFVPVMSLSALMHTCQLHYKLKPCILHKLDFLSPHFIFIPSFSAPWIVCCPQYFTGTLKWFRHHPKYDFIRKAAYKPWQWLQTWKITRK